MNVRLIRGIIDDEHAAHWRSWNEAAEASSRMADQLAEKNRKDGKQDVALGCEIVAEAIRTFVSKSGKE